VIANALSRDLFEHVIEELDAAGRPFAALFDVKIGGGAHICSWSNIGLAPGAALQKN
jgi:hypothetical protein